MADIIDIEILPDGVISVKTEGLSQVNHMSADALLEALEEELGPLKSTGKNKVQHAFWQNKAVQRGGKIVKLGR